jgi:CheY-like chemotaxis protein
MVVLLATVALDRQTDGRIWIAADAVSPLIALDVVYAPARPGGAADAADDSRLATADQLAAAQGSSLEVLPGDGYVTLRLLLPSATVNTVLTIDDNPDLAQLFAEFLRGTRYRLVSAKTAQSALRLAEEVRPDVITLDVMMPFQDGWEIFRQLKTNTVTRAIPVIICSILPEKEVALALGATDFLAKPVTRQSLITTLDRWCPSGSGASRARA